MNFGTVLCPHFEASSVVERALQVSLECPWTSHLFCNQETLYDPWSPTKLRAFLLHLAHAQLSAVAPGGGACHESLGAWPTDRTLIAGTTPIFNKRPKYLPNEGPSKSGLRLSFCSLSPWRSSFAVKYRCQQLVFPPFEWAPVVKCSILMVASVSKTPTYHCESLVWTGPSWVGPPAVAYICKTSTFTSSAYSRVASVRLDLMTGCAQHSSSGSGFRLRRFLSGKVAGISVQVL